MQRQFHIALMAVLCAGSLVMRAGLVQDKKASAVIELAGSDDPVLREQKIKVIKFYSPGCSHCKQIAPFYQDIARASQGDVLFLAYNSDKPNKLVTDYGVTGVPTFVFLDRNNHEVFSRSGGFVSKQGLKKLIDDGINKARGEIRPLPLPAQAKAKQPAKTKTLAARSK